MQRLVISNGPFTSIIASCLLESDKIQYENFFFAYFKNIKEEVLLKHYQEIGKLCDYKAYLNYKDYLNCFKMVSVIKLQQEFQKRNLNFRQILIPINSSTKSWIRIFRNIFPKIEIILYEEGLLSYIKPIFDRGLRKIMQKTKNYYVLYHHNLLKIMQYYLKNINFFRIDELQLKNQFLKFKQIIHLKLIPQTNNIKNTLLFLPQYYYQNNIKKKINRDTKYKEILRYFTSKNYQIVFKEHPKVKNKLTLQNSEPINYLSEIDNYPIEIVLDNFKGSLLFSVYSTSLFTAKYLFGIKSCTSILMLEDRISIFSIYPTATCLFVKKLIPDFKEKNTYISENPADIFLSNNLFITYYLKVMRKIL